jgi:hypothetical protein
MMLSTITRAEMDDVFVQIAQDRTVYTHVLPNPAQFCEIAKRNRHRGGWVELPKEAGTFTEKGVIAMYVCRMVLNQAPFKQDDLEKMCKHYGISLSDEMKEKLCSRKFYIEELKDEITETA